ncbi:MAG: hypothetical protein QOE49_5675, partial [Rhodospirillaceae bacterium]|nr:hypothetical protein [Rhodospirillaceae bacterium]
MGPTPDQIQLIKDYEPALFFVGTLGAPGAERFFPSDAKRYLEKAALYRINAKAELKAQWGDPVLGAGNISALASEVGTFLGDPDTSSPPKYQYLETDPDKELFFDVAGWRPENRFADLDHMAARYAADLKDSQFRYHAEFFDVNRLRQLFDSPADVIFDALFDPRPGKPAVLTDPALICYYLFYPGHEESLDGCTDVNGHPLESARDFGSFAGEWSCIALLLDRAVSSDPYAPKWVGLSNRNTGQIDFGMGEVRSTMRILPWSAMEVYEVTHPRLNVAKGSHGLYVNGEALPVISFTDPAAANCGAAAPIVDPGDREDTAIWTVGLMYKFFAGLAVAGPFGAAAGLIWGLAESPPVFISLAGPNVPAPDTVSNSGFVIYPKGKPPPGLQPGDPNRSAEWKSDPLDIGNRHYD